MEYVTLNNGVHMPLLGLGTWDLRGEDCERVVREAADTGYRLFDTAQMYGNEREVGDALRRSGIDREELFVTTKLYRPSASYDRAKRGIEESLKALDLEYIDLLLIHEPYDQAPAMYRAMEEALERGQVRAIGVSNFKSLMYENLLQTCDVVPAVDQVEAHVYFAQRTLQRNLAAHGTMMQAWAPFTEGRRPIFQEPTLRDIAESHGKTAAQVALRYLIQLGIGVIPKSSKRGRLRQNINVFDFSLTDTEMDAISALDEGKSLFGWY